MAQSLRQYLIVMRHAQRQDEVEDGWATAEAARPNGRPWDPPLSSPLGLSQADEAATKLAAWEERTGSRIVSIVSSPFLRCLQTAAASCRRLGLPGMHISWSVSEALSRTCNVPAGPLPDWMWPCERPAGTEGTAPARGLQPEKYLAQLGAAVAGAGLSGGNPATHGPVCSGEAQAGTADVVEPPCGRAGERSLAGCNGGQLADGGQRAAGQEGEEEAQARCQHAEGVCEEQEGFDGVLQGLSVSILPPPVDPRVMAAAAAAAHTATATTERPCGHAIAADAAEVGSPRREPSLATSSPAMEQAVGKAGSPAAAASEAGTHACNGLHVANQEQQSPGAGGERPCIGPNGRSAKANGGSSPPGGSPARAGAGHVNDSAGSTAAAAAVAAAPPPDFPVPYSVPCSPETLEAAHERYRAAFRCLMAGAAAGASAHGLASGSAVGGCRSQAAGSAEQQWEAAAAWTALWMPLDRGGVWGEAAGGAAAPQLGHGAEEAPPHVPPPQAVTEAAAAENGEASAGMEVDRDVTVPAAEAANGCDCAPGRSLDASEDESASGDSLAGASVTAAGVEGGPADDSGEHEVRRRQSPSQLESPAAARSADGDVQATAAAAAAAAGGQRQAGGPPAAEAVLIVTHGEAVACAVGTVAPWALVYEVQHTGFVVLASEAEQARERAAAGGGSGPDSGRSGNTGQRVEGSWELMPDQDGERGVLWMSSLDD